MSSDPVCGALRRGRAAAAVAAAPCFAAAPLAAEPAGASGSEPWPFEATP